MTAENEIAKQTYSIVFKVQAPSNDANLSSISINGNPVHGFSPGNSIYAINLPVGTSSVPEVSFSLKNGKAVSQVKKAENLHGSRNERTTSIEITAEDGITKKKYSLVFIVYQPSFDASLSGIFVNGTRLNGFSPGNYSYLVLLPPGYSGTPVVTYALTEATATASVKNASNLNGTRNQRTSFITVTAENGIAVKTYSIVFKVYVPSANASLSMLFTDNTPVPGFTPGNLNYSVLLPLGTIVFPTVSTTPENDSAQTNIINATDLYGDEPERTTIINVTAEDGVTVKSYRIVFLVDEDNYLKGSAIRKISIFPNPANSEVTITGLENIKTLELIDNSGIVLREIEHTGDSITVNVEYLQNGFYFFRTESQTLKFIKE